MQEKEVIEIPLSKRKLVKFLVFSILFFVFGLWMLRSQRQSGNAVFDDPFIKNAAACGGIVMGILGIYFFSRKLMDRKPAMIIDDIGIIDNTGGLSVGRIPWADIADIRGNTVQASLASKQHFITIFLKNPDEYIAKEPNALKRKTMAMNTKYAGTPVSISANTLQMDFQELKNILLIKFNIFKS